MNTITENNRQVAREPVVMVCVGYESGLSAGGVLGGSAEVKMCIAPKSLADSALMLTVGGRFNLSAVPNLEFSVRNGPTGSVSYGIASSFGYSESNKLSTQLGPFSVSPSDSGTFRLKMASGFGWGTSYSNDHQLTLTPRAMEPVFDDWYLRVLERIEYPNSSAAPFNSELK